MENLSQQYKESPFKIPEKYFDEFPLRIQNIISQISGQKTEKNFYTLLKPQLAFAFASIVFIAGIFIAINLLTGNKDDSLLTQNDIIALVENQQYKIEDELIEDIWLSDTTFQENSDTTGSTETNEIIDYLIETGIDEYSLIAEL